MTRLFYFLIFICCTQSIWAQSLLTQRFTVNASNQSIEAILNNLQSSDLTFTYSPDVFDVKRRVSIKMTYAQLSNILNKLFQGQNVEYVAMGNQVILRKKRSPKEQVPDPDLDKKEKETSKITSTGSESSTSKDVIASSIEIEAKDSSVGGTKSSNNGVEGGNSTSINAQDSLGANEMELFGVAIITPRWPYDFSYDPTYYLYGRERVRVPNYYLDTSIEAKSSKREKDKTDPEPSSGIRYSGSVYTEATPIDDDIGILIGARLLYYLTPNLGVGVGGVGFISPIYQDDVLSGDYRLTGGYGGLFAEYSFRPMKKVHLNYYVLIGGGGTTYYREFDFVVINPNEDTVPMFVLEPGVTLELNVVRFFRIGLDVNYRYTSAGTLRYQTSDEPIFATESLRGFNLGISLKFGRF